MSQRKPAIGATLREPAGDTRRVIAADGNAERCLGRLMPGERIVGLTKGQFSLLDIIRAVLRQTGPADVRLSTWSTGIRDAETAAWMVRGGDMRSLQLLVDRSFPGRQPQYAARVTELFGDQSIVVTRVHAKVALIAAGDWRIAISSSMNLNRNPRFEQFDLVDDSRIHDFYGAWFDELARAAPHGLTFDESAQEAAFNTALHGGASEDDVIAELTGLEVGTVEKRGAAARRHEREPAEIDAGVMDLEGVEFQRWLMSRALHGLESAEPGSIAYNQCVREVRGAKSALDDIVQAKRADRPPLTPEERATALAGLVVSASDDELEVAVAEWLRRRRYTLEVDAGGTLCLVPFGEDSPGLRLVDGAD